MGRRVQALFATAGAVVLAACNLVLSIQDGVLADGGGGNGAATGGLGGGEGGSGGVVNGSGGTGGGGTGGGGTGGEPTCPPYVFTSSECGAESLDDPENCCVPGHDCGGGACVGGNCQALAIGGPPSMEEAIGVAVVGDTVVWSSGYGRKLYSTGTNGQPSWTTLATIASNSFVTRIAADDTDVYVVDYGGGTVKRVSVESGSETLVTQVSGGEARFGGIAVGADHVFFAMRGTGGVYRGAKDLTDQTGAELVSPVVRPFDVAVDATHVYFNDTTSMTIQRAAQSLDTPSDVVTMADSLQGLAVDDTHVYYGSGGAIRRASKTGTDVDVTTLATGVGNAWDIVVDDTYVYWTDEQLDGVYRAPKDGSSGAIVLTSAQQPWGLAQSCDGLFWANDATQELFKIAK